MLPKNLAEELVILLPPTVSSLQPVLHHLSSLLRLSKENRSVHSLTLLFTPYQSVMCNMTLKQDNLVEKAAAIGLRVKVKSLKILTVPLYDSVISIERPRALREILLEGSQDCLKHYALALGELEQLFGRFKNIRVKGNRSKVVLDLMLKYETAQPELAERILELGLEDNLLESVMEALEAEKSQAPKEAVV